MSEITTKNEGFQYLATLPNRIREKTANIFSKKKVFQFKVLSPLVPYSGPATSTDDPEKLDDKAVDSKYIFKGRIIDEKMAHESYLSDPCDRSIIGTKAGQILTSMHCNIIVDKVGRMPALKVGDTVFAELEAGGIDKLYDLQFVKMKRIKDIFPSNDKREQLDNCQKLGDFFAGFTDFLGDSGIEPVALSDGPIDALVGEITDPNNVELIYWYAGVPAGTYGKNYVVAEIQSLTIGTNKLVVVGEAKDNYANMEAEARTIYEDNNWSYPPSSTVLAGWSGGGEGLAAHLLAKGASSFTRIELADPYPGYLLYGAQFDSNTRMIYRKENWLKNNAIDKNVSTQFDSLIPKIEQAGGSNSVQEPSNGDATSHFSILRTMLQDNLV